MQNLTTSNHINTMDNATKAIDMFWQVVGDFNGWSKEQLERMQEELIQANIIVDDKLLKMKTEKNKPVRGQDINEFWFIGKTRSGCPRLEHREIGDKGIYAIEITNVGNSYWSDGHVAKVRVTGTREDGETSYQLYFTNVYVQMTDAILYEYKTKCEQYQKMLNQKIKNAQAIAEIHQQFMERTHDIIYKKINRS